jgi:hypothetical protein
MHPDRRVQQLLGFAISFQSCAWRTRAALPFRVVGLEASAMEHTTLDLLWLVAWTEGWTLRQTQARLCCRLGVASVLRHPTMGYSSQHQRGPTGPAFLIAVQVAEHSFVVLNLYV